MKQIKEVIIVEGKYDKIKLDSLISATVVQTDGFRIFKNKEKMSLIKKYAETRGIVILTDSDSAGFVIRNHLKSCIPLKYIKNAYVPQIHGKEKRKDKAGKQGLLGVEGLTKDIILTALKNAGCGESDFSLTPITKTHFIADGLSGGKDSKEKRNKLAKHFNLPENMSSNALLDALNSFSGLEKYKEAINELML